MPVPAVNRYESVRIRELAHLNGSEYKGDAEKQEFLFFCLHGTSDSSVEESDKKKLVQNFHEAFGSAGYPSLVIDGCSGAAVPLGAVGNNGMWANKDALLSYYKTKVEGAAVKPNKLVFMGHSRGSATAVWLTEAILKYHSDLEEDAPEIRLYLHDPVTGPLNERNTTRLDAEPVKECVTVMSSDPRYIMGATLTGLNLPGPVETILLPGAHAEANRMKHPQRGDNSVPLMVSTIFYDRLCHFFRESKTAMIRFPRVSVVGCHDSPMLSPLESSNHWLIAQENNFRYNMFPADKFPRGEPLSEKGIKKWVNKSCRPFMKVLPVIWRQCPSQIEGPIKKVFPDFYAFFIEGQEDNKDEAVLQRASLEQKYPCIYQVLKYLDPTGLNESKRVIVRGPKEIEDKFWFTLAAFHQYELFIDTYVNKDASAVLKEIKERFLDKISGNEVFRSDDPPGGQMVALRSAIDDVIGEITGNSRLKTTIANWQGWKWTRGMSRTFFTKNLRVIRENEKVYLPCVFVEQFFSPYIKFTTQEKLSVALLGCDGVLQDVKSTYDSVCATGVNVVRGLWGVCTKFAQRRLLERERRGSPESVEDDPVSGVMRPIEGLDSGGYLEESSEDASETARQVLDGILGGMPMAAPISATADVVDRQIVGIGVDAALKEMVGCMSAQRLPVAAPVPAVPVLVVSASMPVAPAEFLSDLAAEEGPSVDGNTVKGHVSPVSSTSAAAVEGGDSSPSAGAKPSSSSGMNPRSANFSRYNLNCMLILIGAVCIVTLKLPLVVLGVCALAVGVYNLLDKSSRQALEQVGQSRVIPAESKGFPLSSPSNRANVSNRPDLTVEAARSVSLSAAG